MPTNPNNIVALNQNQNNFLPNYVVIFKLFVRITTMNWYQRHQLIAYENEFDSPRRIIRTRLEEKKKKERSNDDNEKWF